MRQKNWCLACGRFCVGEFCGDACRSIGQRYCTQCQLGLRRRSDEKPFSFRIRLTCGDKCLTALRSDLSIARWQNPISRARAIRGLSLSYEQNPESIQHRSALMKAMWANGTITGKLQSSDYFSAKEVQAIRCDTRSNRQVGEAYGVHIDVIRRVRRRMTYKDVTD